MMDFGVLGGLGVIGNACGLQLRIFACGSYCGVLSSLPAPQLQLQAEPD